MLPTRHLAAAAAALLLLAACTGGTGGDGGDRGDRDKRPGPVAEPTTTRSPSDRFATDVFSEDDQVLAVAINEPSTLDPLRLQDPGSLMVARQLYEGLTRWDPVEERPVPAIAVLPRPVNRERLRLTLHATCARASRPFVAGAKPPWTGPPASSR